MPLRLLDLGAIAGQRRADTEGRVHGSLRVILVGDGRTEQRHDPVAEELVHGALVPVHLGQHQLEGAGHEGVDLLGIEARGDRGEAGNVHEEHRHLLALTLDGALGREDSLGEVLGGIGRGRGEKRRFGRFPAHRSPALVAEPGSRGQVVSAPAADRAQAGPAAQAEVRPGRIVVLAPWTLQAGSLQATGPRTTEQWPERNCPGLAWSRTSPRVATSPRASSVAADFGELIRTDSGPGGRIPAPRRRRGAAEAGWSGGVQRHRPAPRSLPVLPEARYTATAPATCEPGRRGAWDGQGLTDDSGSRQTIQSLRAVRSSGHRTVAPGAVREPSAPIPGSARPGVRLGRAELRGAEPRGQPHRARPCSSAAAPPRSPWLW